ncbi:hypothetical protein Zmor_016926 [Zophobas morio]|uniref:Uncharacterized protein n=1 Tax=Zophobas morio TaxID=2755281 RepID=A0AA38I4G1_9CUCU|nr:hypothetical protein Zmor_016926 [Zophobas morio]
MGNSRSIKICNETDDDIIHVDLKSASTVIIRNNSTEPTIDPHSTREFIVNPYKCMPSFHMIPWNFVQSALRLVGLRRKWCRVLVIFRNSGTDHFVIIQTRPTLTVEFTTKSHDVKVTRRKHKNGYKITLRPSTLPQTQDQRAEQLCQEGTQAMTQRRFTEAQEKFEEALRTATDENTKQVIQSSIERLELAMETKAEEIQAEGIRFLVDDLYDEALGRFKESLKLTKKSHIIKAINDSIKETQKLKISDEKALRLLQEGEKLMVHQKYDEATEKCLEAGIAATKSETRDRITATRKKLEHNM